MQEVYPISYFGSIDYYKKLTASKHVAFEIWETYPKHSARNHCKILSPNGILELIVPLKKPNSSKTITKDVLIDYTMDWQKKQWKSIITAYSSSPYFDHYGMEVEEIIFSKHSHLVNLAKEIHTKICSWLSLDFPFEETKSYQKEGIIDFRNEFKNRNLINDYAYQQVFSTKANFIPDLSILDAIFNLGPMARKIIIGSPS